MIDKTILVLLVDITYDMTKNFTESLEEVFTRVVEYNYIENDVNKELVGIVEQVNPDYIFYIVYKDDIQFDILNKIRALGVKIITWGCDDHWRFNNFIINFFPHIDYHITTDIKTALRSDYPVIKSQWAAVPKYYKNLHLPYKIDVSFIGQMHGDRLRHLNYIQRKCSMHIFGRQSGGYITFDEMIEIFNTSRINLHYVNGSNDWNIKQIKASTFAIPMCGGFLLTEYCEGLEEYYELGKEIEIFISDDEAIDKIKYYLKNGSKREKIALAGEIRANKDHTYKKRFTKIFEQLGEI